MLDDLPSTEKALSRLKRLGLSLAIGDFGRASSSSPRASTPPGVEA